MNRALFPRSHSSLESMQVVAFDGHVLANALLQYLLLMISPRVVIFNLKLLLCSNRAWVKYQLQAKGSRQRTGHQHEESERRLPYYLLGNAHLSFVMPLLANFKSAWPDGCRPALIAICSKIDNYSPNLKMNHCVLAGFIKPSLGDGTALSSIFVGMRS